MRNGRLRRAKRGKKRVVRRTGRFSDATHSVQSNDQLQTQAVSPPVPLVVGNEGTLPALYVAQSMDTPESVASRFATSVQLIYDVNPVIERIGRLYPGLILQIPLHPPVLPFTTRTGTEYIVQQGDSFTGIAQRFQIPMTALRQANPLVTPNRIFAGQLLLLPLLGELPPLSVPVLLYVVQPEDTMNFLSGLFGVDIAAIEAANPQRIRGMALRAGEIISLPVAGVVEPPVFDRTRYIVQPMDDALKVATTFEVWLPGLLRLNPVVEPIPGLLWQLPKAMPAVSPPLDSDGQPVGQPAPFGIKLNLDDDNSVFVPFPADFQLPFYGEIQRSGVWVNANGNITFTIGDNTFVPSTDTFVEGPPRIAPFWTDLWPLFAVGTGGVFINFASEPDGNNKRMCITWDRVPLYGGEQFYTVQALLHQDGAVDFCYFAVPAFATDQPQPRVLIGVAPGGGGNGSNIFAYTGEMNQRRTGALDEELPQGSLDRCVLHYQYVPEQGNYQLIFTCN